MKFFINVSWSQLYLILLLVHEKNSDIVRNSKNKANVLTFARPFSTEIVLPKDGYVISLPEKKNINNQ